MDNKDQVTLEQLSTALPGDIPPVPKLEIEPTAERIKTPRYSSKKEIEKLKKEFQDYKKLVERDFTDIDQSLEENFTKLYKAVKKVEVFNPEEIAKFLSLNSNITPTTLKKLTGKSKVITPNVKVKENTATKVSGGMDAEYELMTDILSDIYTLMKKSKEDDTKQKELDKDFEESKKQDREKKHKEFIEAIRSIKAVQIFSEDEPEKENNIFGDIGKQITDYIEMRIASAMASFVSSLVSAGVSTSLALGAISAALAGNEQRKAAESAQKGDYEKTATAERRSNQYQQGAFSEFDMSADSNVDAAARQELESAASRGSVEAKNKLKELEDDDKKNEKKIKYVQALGYDVDDGVVALAHKGGFLGLGGQRITDEELKNANLYPEGKIGLPKPTKPSSSVTNTTSSNSKTKQSIPTIVPTLAPSSLSSFTPPVPVSPPSAASVPSPNKGAELNSKVSQNQDMKLTQNTITEPKIINNTSSSSTSTEGSQRIPIPPVRNTEDTFGRLSMYATRTV